MKRHKSPKMTSEIASKILYLYYVVGLYQHQIASIFGFNQGRISEVVTGKRFPCATPKDFQLTLPI